MRKVTKTVIARHLGEEFPLKINVTETPDIEHSKSSLEIPQHTTYQFECSLDNLDYKSESKNDASIAFKDLCRQLEEHGYKICCCGTCMHFYGDWVEKHWFGGIYGVCHKDHDSQKPHTKKNIRHILKSCKDQMLDRDAEHEFILEE